MLSAPGMNMMSSDDMQMPGMPKRVEPSMFTGNQTGTMSVNTKDNPHWNDVLAYTPDGSLIRYNGMDFIPVERDNYVQNHGTGTIKYNKICWQRCCVKTDTVMTKATNLTWLSTDGAHKISLLHKQANPYSARDAGICSPCYPCCFICLSGTCCKPCFDRGSVDYGQLLAPEFFYVTYDGERVAEVEVQPGCDKESPVDARAMARMTTARDKHGKPIFVMNNVFLPENAKDFETLRCCAWKCCPCLECFKPCCCPICLPCGGGCRCPRPTCNCGPCTFCCNKACGCLCGCITWGCRCRPCFMCCQCACTCCNLGCKCCKSCVTCACCKCGVSESIEVFSKKEPKHVPQSRAHKAHRIIYPLPTTQGGNDVYAWAAYTHMESSTQSHRATLAMDPKQFECQDVPKEVLASLPVLIDLAIGSTGGDRHMWTFESRSYNNVFDPEDVVHFFKRGEKLQTVVASYKLQDIINPVAGDIAPKQHKMEDATEGERTNLIGKPAWKE